MFRTLALAAAVAALAVPAFAAPATQVTINVAGMDAKTAHAAILHAAQQACQAEFADSSDLVKFYARPDCISGAVATAETKFAAMRGLASR
jgi:hypothetical protein